MKIHLVGSQSEKFDHASLASILLLIALWMKSPPTKPEHLRSKTIYSSSAASKAEVLPIEAVPVGY